MVHPADRRVAVKAVLLGITSRVTYVRSRTDRRSTRIYSPLGQDVEPRLG